MSVEYVLLDTVSGKLEAEIIHGMLQAYGIDAMMSHEAAASIYGLGIGPTADVDLLVPEDKLAEAKQHLEEYRHGGLEDQD